MAEVFYFNSVLIKNPSQNHKSGTLIIAFWLEIPCFLPKNDHNVKIYILECKVLVSFERK